MICRECGVEITDEAAFCPQCGARLANGGEAQQSPAERLRSAASDRQQDDDADDEIVWQGTYSKKAMFGIWFVAAVVTLILLVGAGILGAGTTAWAVIAVVIVVLWLVLILLLLYKQFSVRYFLSDQRFIHESGLLWRTIDRIELIDIDDVTFHQGPIERILDVGTIRISSSDITHPEFELPGIERVREVAGQIDDLRRRERRRRGLHIEAV